MIHIHQKKKITNELKLKNKLNKIKLLKFFFKNYLFYPSNDKIVRSYKFFYSLKRKEWCLFDFSINFNGFSLHINNYDLTKEYLKKNNSTKINTLRNYYLFILLDGYKILIKELFRYKNKIKKKMLNRKLTDELTLQIFHKLINHRVS